MRTTTIDALLARAVYLGSLDGQVGTNLRHTEAEAFVEANAAFRAMVQALEAADFDFYHDSTDPASLPARDADFDRRVIAWPASYRRVLGVSVRRGSTAREEWRQLVWSTWTQRHTVCGDGDLPTHYTIRDAPDASEAGEIHLIPGGTASGQYVVQFALEFADVATGESFPFYDQACEDWCAAELAWRMVAVRDGDAEERARGLREMQADAMAKMRASAPKAVEGSRIVEVGAGRLGRWPGILPH